MATSIPTTASAPSIRAPRSYDPRLRLARASAIIVISLSAATLIGWLLDVDVLQRIAPWFDPTSFQAATAFLMLSIALHLAASPTWESSPSDTYRLRLLLLGFSIVAASIGIGTLLESLLRMPADDAWPPRIEQADAALTQGMSLLSSVAVLILGSVFILRSFNRAPVVREWLALISFALGYLALMGYVYGAESLYRIGATAIPVQSAIFVLLIASGFLLLPPHHGFMRPIVSRGPGGILVRRLLPVALFVVPAIDWLQTKAGGHLGESSMAFIGLANVALLAALVWMTGKAVQLAHSERKRLEENVKTTEERLLLALQAAGGGAWDLDLQHGDTWWSTEMYNLWDVRPEDAVRLENSLGLIDPRDRDHVMRAVRSAIDQHATYECEFRLQRHGENERWMASRGRVHYDSAGKPTRLIGITVDISGRKAAEISLRKTNEALVRSNIDLQRFAHVAAHDLQTPLRGIGSFAELLNMRYRDRLDETSRGWLDRILGSAIQLHALVRDLLAYSSIDVKPFMPTPVSMDEALDRALELVEAEARNAQCVVTRSTLPVVLGEAAQLAQLLCNLVSNSIKYRSAETPKVHVSAQQSDGNWVISVRDNGIGIDPRHSDRIFNVFERLHGAERYPGTGIGLSICRRIVQRHGGSMWVDSQPGSGSTFMFTLPSATR